MDRSADSLVLLGRWLEQHPGLDLLAQVFQFTLEARGPESALALVRSELHRQPSLPALDKYLEARLLQPLASLDPATGTARESTTRDTVERADLELARTLVQRQVNRLSVFICRQCGFKARKFHWHCPACGQWESYPPRRHAELDEIGRAPSM